MKYKKFKKKLALSKKTIANLNAMEMTLPRGGNFEPGPVITKTCHCFEPDETLFTIDCTCGPTCLC